MRPPFGNTVLMALLALVLWGCTNPGPSPVIGSFSATPNQIFPGEAVQLSWNVTNAESITIAPDVGTVSGTSVTVRPNQTTEYTLTATNKAGSSQAKTTITVTPPGSVPANFRVARAESNQIELAWDRAGGVSGYVLEVARDSGFSKLADLGAETTSYIHRALQPNTLYTYRIRPLRGSDAGSPVELKASTAAGTPVVLAENTRVVDGATRAALQAYNPSTGTLRYTSLTPQLASLRPGDIVVSEPGPGAPAGYLRKVRSVQPDGAGLVVETEGAELAETLQQGSIQASQKIDDPNAYTAQPLVEGVRLRQPGQVSLQAVADCQKNGTRGLTIDIPNVEIAKKEEIDDTGKVKVVAKISAEGCVRLDPSLFFNLDVRPLFDVQRFEAGVAIAQEAKLKVNLEGSITLKKEVEILRLLGPTVTFHIGPVPVVMQPSFVVSVGVSGKYEFKVSFGVKHESSLRTGVSYLKGPGWSLINDRQGNWTPISPIEKDNLRIKFALEAFASASPGLTFYGTINAALVVQVFAKFDLEIPRNPWWKLVAGLRFGFKADLSPLFKDVKLDLFAPDIELLKLESPNSPPDTPLITSPRSNQQAFALVPIVLSGSAFDLDDGDFATGLLPCTALRWSSSNTLDTPLLPGNACGSPTVTFQTPGSRTLTLTATDPRGASASARVEINVQPAPSLRILSPQANTIPPNYCSQGTVTLEGQLDGSDPATNDLRWSWRNSSGVVTEIRRGGREILTTVWTPGGSGLGRITLRLEQISRNLVFEVPVDLVCIN